ncbi:lamin tail domain-containing protein [Candidatus Sumerlaeota bacterium]
MRKMRHFCVVAAFGCALLCFGFAPGKGWCADTDIAINEIMYNPGDENLGGEFIELYNRGDSPVDVGGWQFNNGITFTFPSPTDLAAHGYIIVCEDAVAAAAYYGVSVASIAGTYEGRLDNGGERIALVDDAGVEIDTVRYNDNPPWPIAADGSGPSLELVDADLDNARGINWKSGGFYSPGAANSQVPTVNRDIVINEIMYNPPSLTDAEEYLELVNKSTGSVSLDGWLIRGGIDFTFPPGTSLAAGEYLVVAKSTAAFFIADPSSTATVIGNYSGRFNNAGDRAALMNSLLEVVDEVSYKDNVPWPKDADGTGSSLELLNPGLDNRWPETWAAGALNGTPGLPNSVYEADPSPVVRVLRHDPAVPTSSDSVAVTAFILDDSAISTAGLHYDAGNARPNFGVFVGETWKFFRGWSEPSGGTTDWTGTTFDDSSWEQGPTGIGYGDGDDATILDDMQGNYVSVYLRKTFTVDDAASVLQLNLRADWDDGFIAYINGQEVARRDMGAAGQFFAYNTGSAALHEVGVTENIDLASMIGYLQTGANVIAIQCHNDNPASSDLSMIPELTWSTTVSEEISGIVTMFDDGNHLDGIAGDGIYGGLIPPVGQGAIVEFYVDAEDDTGNAALAPASAPADNCLYQVDQNQYTTGFALYRIVMTEADATELATRDPDSNVKLNSTFIEGDSSYYNVGIRYRGSSTRLSNPKSYRIDFWESDSFGETTELNLNGYRPERAIMGWDLVERFGGLYPADWQLVSVVYNNAFYLNYLQIESVDGPFIRKNFPGDDQGNLYRANKTADLSYRGDDPSLYRDDYIKKTNGAADDYNDIFRLTDVFTNSSDAEFPDLIEQLIDVPQWARFFAFHNVVANREGGIYLDTGDDYYLYHRGVDDKFVIIPWDMDDTYRDENMVVFRATTPAIIRLLHHPRFVRYYYAAIDELLWGEFTIRAMRKPINLYRGQLPTTELDDIWEFVTLRRDYLFANIPQLLTYDRAEVEGTTSSLQIDIVEGDAWRYFKGQSEPSGGALTWTQIGFNDSAWAEGPTGMGYGDGDDTTVLGDMMDNYWSVYLRKTFNVTDPGEVTSLTLSIDYDDGFIAYINGTEVARRQMGNPGQFYAYNAAAGNHEAGVAETINLASYISLLQSGDNVIAIQAHNTTLDSSDFSIIPGLSSGLGGSSCAKFMVSAPSAILHGHSNAAHTVGVMVDGEPATWDPLDAEWSKSVVLQPGLNNVLVEAIDENGLVREALTLPIYQYYAGREKVGGTAIDETWTLAEGPYIISGMYTVQAGATLRIEAGTPIFIEAGSGITVLGGIVAEGTSAAPIRFMPRYCAPWDLIEVDTATGPSEFSYCEFRDSAAVGDGSSTFIACLTFFRGHAVIDNCVFRDSLRCVEVRPDASIDISNTMMINTREALHCDHATAIIDGCSFINTIGYADCIDFDGDSSPTSVVRNCYFGWGGDDAIDTEGTNVLIEDNIIMGHDVDDGKAISLQEVSNPIIRRNVIYACDVAIAIKNSCDPIMDHNTIVNCGIGIHSYEKNAGTGPGYGTLTNSIVWGNDIDVWLENGSVLDTSYSNSGIIFPGSGNISVDPWFADPATANYRLRAGSLCIGAGSDQLNMGAYLDVPEIPVSLSSFQLY